MHFLPFVSAILATAVLVSSEQSQYNSFDITEVDGDTPSTEISNDGNLAGNFNSPGEQAPTAGREAPRPGPGGANPNSRQQIPPQELSPDTQQQQMPPPGVNPYGRQQENSPSGGNPYGRQQDGSSPTGQQREQSPLPDDFTRPPPSYRGDQHCREWGGCPFECHTNCVCWEWCKNANCNLAGFGEAALTSTQISCDPSAGEKFIGKICRPYCANWCEDMKNQIVQVLTSDQEQRAFLSRPLECDKNYYNCPNDPNPNRLDCLKPTNPLDPGFGGQRGSSGSYGNQQVPNSGYPPDTYSKELDKTDAQGTTDFSLDESW